MSKSGKAHLNAVYGDPLPLDNVIPLPPLDFFNPVALARYCYWYYRGWRGLSLDPARSRLTGRFDVETKSVWVLQQKHQTVARAVLSSEERATESNKRLDSADRLWRAGFFGKGQFSRSEPSWHVRNQRTLGLIGRDEGLTAEEITARRRTARARMKRERADRERERLRETLLAEGKTLEVVSSDAAAAAAAAAFEEMTSLDKGSSHSLRVDGHGAEGQGVEKQQQEEEEERTGIPNLESLQLTLYEAVFLALPLDCLDITSPRAEPSMYQNAAATGSNDQTLSKRDILSTALSCFEWADSTRSPFLIQYAVYHHYRTLGWTVKPGIKFGVDWLLYRRGPVFSHAEFSIVVLACPMEAAVHGPVEERAMQRQAGAQEGKKPWWWLHMVSRVNGQVKKTVILTHVSFQVSRIPEDMELSDLLKLYKIREVSVRRWVPSRHRD